jgi:hypothetical protein
MGLFSFLFGGKKQTQADAPAKPVVVETTTPVQAISVTPSSGVTQAMLRLKLAASLRSGHHGVAYEAALGLADIQIRAGRRHVARVWEQQAERIKAGMSA